jgi:hypothetical protein
MKAKNELHYYVLDTRGYESYQPYWFLCNCSKEEFEKEVSLAIDKAMSSFSSEEGFICGNDLLSKVIPLLSKKFQYLTPEHEVTVLGECLYSNGNKDYRPSVISERSWQKIIRHNEKVHKSICPDLRRTKKRQLRE